MKHALAVLFVVFAAIIIGGCSNVGEDAALAEALINESSTTQEIQQFIESAVERGDAGMCLKIPNKMPICMFRLSCIAQVAEHKMDLGTCNKITPCKDAGEYDLSGFASDNCKSDVELAKVSDIALQGDYRNCLNLKGAFARHGNEVERKELCLMQVGINQSNPEICKLISDDDFKKTCLFFSSLN